METALDRSAGPLARLSRLYFFSSRIHMSKLLPVRNSKFNAEWHPPDKGMAKKNTLLEANVAKTQASQRKWNSSSERTEPCVSKKRRARQHDLLESWFDSVEISQGTRTLRILTSAKVLPVLFFRNSPSAENVRTRSRDTLRAV